MPHLMVELDWQDLEWLLAALQIYQETMILEDRALPKEYDVLVARLSAIHYANPKQEE